MSYFYHIVCSLLLISCNNSPAPKQAEPVSPTPVPAKNSTKYINSIQFTSPSPNSTFNYHDAVKIAFSTKEKFPADSIQIFWKKQPQQEQVKQNTTTGSRQPKQAGTLSN